MVSGPVHVEGKEERTFDGHPGGQPEDGVREQQHSRQEEVDGRPAVLQLLPACSRLLQVRSCMTGLS